MDNPVTRPVHIQMEVLSDLEAISHRAASLFVNVARSVMLPGRTLSVALSGGTTPKRCYGLLGRPPYRDQVVWQHIHFFWADERCVPKNHEASNFRTAFDTLLSNVPVPEENLHRIRGEEDPEKAAADYEREIREFFGNSGMPTFDLVVLGMGEDGHTASLFPGSSQLMETDRLAVPVYMKKPDWDRVTLTLPVLNHAARVLFLVSGRSKADLLSAVVGDDDRERRIPAGLIRPVHGSLTWLVDQEASGIWKGKESKGRPRD